VRRTAILLTGMGVLALLVLTAVALSQGGAPRGGGAPAKPAPAGSEVRGGAQRIASRHRPASASAAPPAVRPEEEPLWAIYSVGRSGQGMRRLASLPSEVPQAAAWSPSGKSIVFTRPNCDECDAGLWIMHRTGAGQRRLPGKLARVSRPNWSADGRTIAVTGLAGAIYAVGARSGHARRVSRGGAAYESASWSPDGRRIVASRRVSATDWDIYLLDAKGRSVRRLTRGPRQDLSPAWSPDGRRVAFQRQNRQGIWMVWIMNRDGSHQRPLTGGSTSVEQPSWSPDGRSLACVRVTLSGSRIIVLRVAGRGGQANPVTPSFLEAAFPAWAPDGRAVLFSAKHRSSVE
jgi:Tol biopolymer transport system component